MPWSSAAVRATDLFVARSKPSRSETERSAPAGWSRPVSQMAAMSASDDPFGTDVAPPHVSGETVHRMSRNGRPPSGELSVVTEARVVPGGGVQPAAASRAR